jgi:hypothetical protein
MKDSEEVKQEPVAMSIDGVVRFQHEIDSAVNATWANTTSPAALTQKPEEDYLGKAYRLANELRNHLSTAPAARPQWVGLTDWEREELRYKADEADTGYMQLIKATEAKLREKNGITEQKGGAA